MADAASSAQLLSTSATSVPSASTAAAAHQLMQFDWRLVTTVGCSTSSSILRSSESGAAGRPNGLPLLQLVLETAARTAPRTDADDVEDYFTKYPSAPSLSAGGKPSDSTHLWELTAGEVDEVISRLQAAVGIAEKACPPVA